MNKEQLRLEDIEQFEIFARQGNPLTNLRDQQGFPQTTREDLLKRREIYLAQSRMKHPVNWLNGKATVFRREVGHGG